MNAFPQLSSGAVAQFPFEGEVRFRTALNELPDGSEISFNDPDFEQRRWLLRFEELSEAEWQSLRDLFEVCEGRLKTFTLAAPGANLLAWSEALTESVWTAAGGGSVSDGQPDPLGGTAGSRLTAGGGALTVSQSLAIPASYFYAGSAWARTSAPGAQLEVNDAAGSSKAVPLDSDNQWRRYELRAEGLSAQEQVAVEISAPAGATVDVYGLQLEAQRAVSSYKKTGVRGGVFANARFDQDELDETLTAVGRHSGVVRIVWAPSQS